MMDEMCNDYEAAEKEHFGDFDKKTGIYKDTSVVKENKIENEKEPVLVNKTGKNHLTIHAYPWNIVTARKLLDEMKELRTNYKKARIKMRNQKKHLRWFNRQYDSYNRGRKMGQREESLLDKEQNITCREDLDKLSAFLHEKLDHIHLNSNDYEV